jgi:uncharacterized membrane protein
MIMSFAVSCLVGTLLTDLAYWGTALMMWANFSSWLIAAGVVVGWIAVLIGIFDYFTARLLRDRDALGIYVIGNIVALIIATVNLFVHTRDAWTSVVPWGIALSALTVLILIVTCCVDWSRFGAAR